MKLSGLGCLSAPLGYLSGPAGCLSTSAGCLGSATAGVVRAGLAAASGAATSMAAQATGQLRQAQQRAGTAVTAAAGLGRQRTRRQVWAHGGRAHIEVRGLTGSGAAHRRLARDLTGALMKLKGVQWAEVNAVTAQVLVCFDEDEVDAGALVAAVADVERDHGTGTAAFAPGPPHPAAGEPLAAAATALAGDALGIVTAATARALRLAPLPRAVRVPLAVAEAQPRVRQALADRAGPMGADLLLAAGNALANGLSGGYSPLAVDAAVRLLQLIELRARQEVWNRQEQALHATGHALPAERPAGQPRPVPLPAGPVERAADRASLAALAGAGGLLAWTRDPGRAADLLLATVPKAARLGREGFACTLGTELARHGVVPLDGSVLRRLDRITAVVIDSAVLLGPGARILPPPAAGDAAAGDAAAGDAAAGDAAAGDAAASSNRTGGGDAAGAAPAGRAAPAGAGAWLAAQRLLAGRLVTDLTGPGPWRGGGWQLRPAGGDITGPHGLTLDLTDGHGRARGRFLAGRELGPRAETLLGAARDCARHVVLTGHASTAELAPWADEVLPAGRSLTRLVRRLQRAGHGVLVISSGQHRALAAADAGVAVLTPEHGVSWAADLVCPSLADAWRTLCAVSAARRASERSARLAMGGSTLGALLIAAGRGPQRTRAGLAPAQSAALLAIGAGALTARSAGRLPAPPAAPRGDWHAMSADAVLARLTAQQAAPAGRPARSPAKRHAALGLAAPVLTAPARGALELASAVRKELQDPLTPVLALGAMASAVVGSGVDAALVGGVMAGNALISGAQRMRAERSLGRLLAGEEPAARLVHWPGPGQPPADLATLAAAPQEVTLAAVLRPGDLIALRPFDVVPADARLLAADGLEVDESTLTGESLPAGKSAEPTPGAPVADRTCMLYEGSTILAGSAVAVVVATGDATEAGRAALAAGRAAPPTGIQARLAELTRISVPASGLGGLAVAGLGLLRGVPLREAVASGVAVAVAAVPEGLPLVATVAQLAAARRLSRTGVLVRSSRALEALGRVDVVCFDKTGTLTEGRLRVSQVATLDGEKDLGGPAAQRLLRVAARACPPPGGQRRTLFHATDRAVVEAARQRAGADRAWRLADELPFEASRGYAASLGTNAGRPCLAVKGAPEVVLPRCIQVTGGDGTAVPLTPARRRAASRLLHELAGQGLRVLAVAERPLPGPLSGYHLTNGHPNGRAPGRPGAGGPGDLVTRLTLDGFVAIADTPRPAASDTVRQLTEAGVRVTMVTGDHPATAVAVARELGIPGADQVLTGAEISQLPDAEQVRRITAATVFARVSPEQKVRIVQALQRAGHVVAMGGDGTNDAAAIRLADVGIGVAARGSRSARGAADLVLTGAGTLPLVDALLEGRALWARVRDAVSILVGGNAGEVAFTVLGTALTGRAPLSTRQLLLVNTLTDMLPALAVALAGTGRARGAGQRLATAGPTGPLLGPELGRGIALRGGATALGATLAWHAGRLTGRRRRASTMALSTLVLTQLGQTLVTSGRSPLVAATSAVSAGALTAIVETPGVSQFFGCTPLGPAAWAIVTGSAATATVAAAVAPRLAPALTGPAAAPA